jgi:hypothetical protein
VTIAKTGTGTWRTASIPVPGVEYAGALAGGADLAVSEQGSDATAFAMIEVAVDGR